MGNAPHGAVVLAGIVSERLGCANVIHGVVDPARGTAEVRWLNARTARQATTEVGGSSVWSWSPGEAFPLPGRSWETSVAVVHLGGGLAFSDRDLGLVRDVAGRALLTVVTADLRGASGADAVVLGATLRGVGVQPTFVGCARRGSMRGHLDVVVALVDHPSVPPPTKAPGEFKVVAIVTAFNEEDIIVSTLSYLIDQGIEVHLVDNWSTDRTAELARPFLGRGLLGIEQFPPGGPSGSFDLGALLKHVEDLATSLDADWFVHHDVDERRLAPWPGLTLRDGLYNADLRGFTAIDHSHIDFQPTDNSFVDGTDPAAHFHWFAPPIVVRDNAHVKAWKNLGIRVDLASSGGHEAKFPGRRVFPYNFLLKHYPFRSQQHGEKKVLNERKARWNTEERKRGWHFGYDHIRQGHSFLKDEADLYLYDADFESAYLLERLAPLAQPADQVGRARRLRRRLVPILRRTRLLAAVVWVQRRYRVLLRRDVASGRR